MHSLDDIDRRLLRLLQEEAGLPVTELAERAGVSAGACWRRIEKMERARVILGRAIDIDPRALGYEVRVFLRVVLDKAASHAFDDFLAAARALPEVIAIETLLGRVDIRMDVVARDLAHYQEIYRDRILALPHIAEIDALMLVSELKNSARLPI
ncbi:Lrp/AsnC family transcriptional regulator [Amaricoccus solimangrovi]|uniref:Lrp/AsnC family transcriptional regulator n=1 Tax=Amaricoccus solimangrovi TaxID=2589815 RepID=A0A501WZ73_9RHOB|nr:Lrp/AsnC family transcriptional regulator [Amaricoccus solimangrovi]TPE53694.1 Lrp/AsnC family transcriptional regulator [Amaricoccus solimangrovi]